MNILPLHHSPNFNGITVNNVINTVLFIDTAPIPVTNFVNRLICQRRVTNTVEPLHKPAIIVIGLRLAPNQEPFSIQIV